MNQPAKAQEPSMEEILASIRRIISDDEAKPAAAAAAPTKPEPAKPTVAKTEQPRPAPAPEPKSKPAAPRPAAAAPAKAPDSAPAPAPAEKNSQADIDAMMASFDAPEPTAPEGDSTDNTDNDVFELTEQMAVPEAAPAAFQKVQPDDDLEFAESGSAVAPHATRVDPPTYDRPSRNQPADMPSILSSTAAASVESAFNALASTVLSNNARTLEDLVKEMLRPMLKSWLDDNLPSLVERIVRAEIERVSRGR
jgi:cell pole-organizing protein PopZ